MTELLLLAAVAFAAGFGTGWSLRAALARADERDEIVDLEWVGSPWTDNQPFYRGMVERGAKEYFKARGDRS